MNNETLVEEFLTYLRAERGLSVHTQSGYRNDLRQLYTYAQREKRAWPPDIETVIGFLKSIQGIKKPASIARAISAAKAFFKYLFREQYITEDRGSFLESPKLWKTLPKILHAHEVTRAMELPDQSTDEGIRDRAILELLYGTGIRVSELCALCITDISDDVIKVKGKGGKERLVPIGGCALEAVDKYLLAVRQKFDSLNSTQLFVTKRGKPVSRVFVWRLVRMYAAKSGIEKEISPHTFRHTYASHLLDAGADPRVIQELLGHAHISSTDRYTQVSCSQLKEVFRAFHPRWNEWKDEKTEK
jgi:integrase/recombinase XerD